MSHFPSKPFEALWTAQQVADFLQTSRSWVYQRSAQNLLPYVKVGALLRFDPDKIRALVRGEASAPAITPSKR